MDSRRLDAALVERGLASGREKAKELIAGGLVRVNGHPAAKPAQLVKEADAIECDTRSLLYVGRGGYKLQKALDVTGWRLEGVKTTGMGSLFELRYTVVLKDPKQEKAFLDELRCRNGNLTLSLTRNAPIHEEL